MGRQWAATLACFSVFLLMGSDRNQVTLEVSVRTNDDSRPIPRAELIVERVGNIPAAFLPHPEDDDWRTITRAESNERGEIVLRELPAVPMRLTLKADGYSAPVISDLDGRSRHRTLELRLPRAIAVTGLVVDESGAAVPDVDVTIESVLLDRQGKVFHAAGSFSARTDTSGGFRINGVPDGSGKIKVLASGYTLSDDGAFRDLARSPLTLRLQRTCVLRVDIDAPLHLRGQYWITVEKKDAKGLTTAKHEKQGADRGWITFPELPAGRYSVTASLRNARDREQPLTATADVDLGRPADVKLGPAK